MSHALCLLATQPLGEGVAIDDGAFRMPGIGFFGEGCRYSCTRGQLKHVPPNTKKYIHSRCLSAGFDHQRFGRPSWQGRLLTSVR